MRRVAALLVTLVLASGLACETLTTPDVNSGTPPPPDLEATVRAVVSQVQSAEGAEGDPDATITARVQATVQALMAATPIPSPTPTGVAAVGSVPPTPVTSPTQLPTATPTSTPLPTRVPTQTPVPTQAPTPTPPACGPVSDGTQVSAWVEGSQIASAEVLDGKYTMFVDPGDGSILAGKTITFKIGELTADETVVLVVGGATELDLRISPAGRVDPTPEAGYTTDGPGYGGLLAQMVPPHVFVGAASVSC